MPLPSSYEDKEKKKGKIMCLASHISLTPVPDPYAFGGREGNRQVTFSGMELCPAFVHGGR